MEHRTSYKIATAVAIIVMIWFSLGTATAGRDESKLRARLSADMSFGDISGKADFRSRDGRRQFSVEIEGLTPGDRFDVTVAGRIVGTITIDDFGVGDINFDDNYEPGDDVEASRFPPNFPSLDGGERIIVGPLSGSVQRN